MEHLRYRRDKKQRGTVIFESVLSICIIMMVFFGLFQVYKWAMAELFCHYSIFYSTKGVSLGYKTNIALRGARVAAIAISGGGVTHADEKSMAENYMVNGDAGGWHYPYWHPQNSNSPYLRVSSTATDRETVECLTILRNMPLVHEAIGTVFGIRRNPEPSARAEAYNYSKLYLKE